MLVTINLREFYPFYTHDEFVEVSEEVAAEMMADKRYERTHERNVRRHKIYSLDADDGIEAIASAMSCQSNNPEAIFSVMDTHCRICHALNILPELQGRRVEARYIFGKSVQEIAKSEGVSESSIKESLERGLKTMRKIF